MTKRLRQVVYPPLGLALLAALGLVALSTPWFRRLLERRVKTGLEQLTGARVEIGEFHFNPLIMHVTMHRVILHGSELAAEPPLLTAGTLAFQVSPTPALGGKFRLERLDIDQAEGHLVTHPDGSTNFPGPRAAETTHGLGKIMELSVGRVTVSHSNFYWNDRRLPLEFHAQSFALQVRSRLGRPYLGTLSSNAIEIEAPRLSLPPTNLTSRFELSRTNLKVNAFEWRAPGLAGEGSSELSWAPDIQGWVLFQARGDATEISKIFRLGKFQLGSVTAQGRGVYRDRKWSLDGDLNGRQVLLPAATLNLGRLDFTSHFSVDESRFQLSNLRIFGLSGSAEGRIEVPFEDTAGPSMLRGQLRDVSLRGFLSSLSPSHALLGRLPWAARLNGTLQGTWRHWPKDLQLRFDIQSEGRGSSPAGSLPVAGSVEGTATALRGFAFELRSVEIRTPHSLFTAHGTLGGAESNLAVQLTTTNFEEWRLPVEMLFQTGGPIPLELHAPASFSGTVLGSSGMPSIRGRLIAGAFDFRRWRWNRLVGDVAVSPNFFEITSGRLEGGNSVLVLDASAGLKDWQFTSHSPVRLIARAERTPLDGLKAALGVTFPFGGLATGHLDLAGTTASLSGTGLLEIDRGTFAQQSFDRLRANIHVTESVWSADSLELDKAQAKISGHAAYDPARRWFSLVLQGKDISPADFTMGGTRGRDSAGWQDIHGQGSFDLEGQGTVQDMSLIAAWNIRDMSVAGMPVGTAQGRVDWKQQKMHVEGGIEGVSGTLNFNGEAPTQGDWPLEMTGGYKNFQATPWIRLLLGGKFDTFVSATGSLALRGPLRQPSRVEVQSQVQNLQVNVSKLAWRNDQPVALRYRDGVLSAQRFRMRGPATNLEVEGSIRFGQRAALALTAQGQSDAALLSLLDPALQATGQTQVDLHINGTPAHPLYFGLLKVQELNLSYGELPFHLFGLNGDIRLEGDRATARSLQGVSGGGSVTVRGYMTLVESPRFDLEASVNQVHVQYPVDFTSQLTGTLRLSGTGNNSRLNGELMVRQFSASPNFSVLSLVSQVGSPLVTPAIGVNSPVASTVRLNILVSSAPTIRLETADLQLVADVDLRVLGTLANPVLGGSIHLLNGETVIRGNRYKITRGDISMANPLTAQPMLDLEATTRVERYDLTLDVSGPLDQIKLAYRSDPPLPTADILSLMALGYSREQSAMSVGQSERASTVGASALLSEALSTQTTGRIQRLFGVSRIKIDPNVGGPLNVAGARVTVEQQVTHDLTVTYVTDTSSSLRRIIQFEWAVSENTSLIGIRDQNGIFGVEVRFRRRFR